MLGSTPRPCHAYFGKGNVMAPNGPIRFYATFKTTPDLLARYRRADHQELTRFTVGLLNHITDRARRTIGPGSIRIVRSGLGHQGRRRAIA